MRFTGMSLKGDTLYERVFTLVFFVWDKALFFAVQS